MFLDLCELYRHKLIIYGRESDAKSRRDNDIGAPSDKLRVKVA